MTTGPYSQGNLGMSASSPNPPGPGLPPEGVGVPVEREETVERDIREIQESLSAELAERLWWVLPVLLIALGFLLGWADQNALSLKNDLRFPAMIAALLLFGQGGAEILARVQRRAEEAEAIEAAEAAEHGQVLVEEITQAPGAPPPARLVSRSAITPTTPSGASMLAIALMALGVWLGLETLYVQVKLPVVTLSLLASFLLFTFGWKLLTKGP